MTWKYDDGGRKDAGYTGDTGDCVCRAIAIAAEIPYQEVYDRINTLLATSRQTKRVRGRHARTGVNRVTYERLLKSMGWTWHPTMRIGSGCKVHLRADELPKGRLIVRVSRHLAAVIDGVIHDTHDPSRDGTRCVYGYYTRDV